MSCCDARHPKWSINSKYLLHWLQTMNGVCYSTEKNKHVFSICPNHCARCALCVQVNGVLKNLFVVLYDEYLCYVAMNCSNNQRYHSASQHTQFSIGITDKEKKNPQPNATIKRETTITCTHTILQYDTFSDCVSGSFFSVICVLFFWTVWLLGSDEIRVKKTHPNEIATHTVLFNACTKKIKKERERIKKVVERRRRECNIDVAVSVVVVCTSVRLPNVLYNSRNDRERQREKKYHATKHKYQDTLRTTCNTTIQRVLFVQTAFISLSLCFSYALLFPSFGVPSITFVLLLLMLCVFFSYVEF